MPKSGNGQSNRLIMRQSYTSDITTVINLGLLSDVTPGQCGAHYVLARQHRNEDHKAIEEFGTLKPPRSTEPNRGSPVKDGNIHFFVRDDRLSLEDAYTSALVSLGVPKEYACYGNVRGKCPQTKTDIDASLDDFGIKCSSNANLSGRDINKTLFYIDTSGKIKDFGVAFGIKSKIAYFIGMPFGEILVDIPQADKNVSKNRLFEKVIAVCQMMNIKLVLVPLELSTETVKSAVCLKKYNGEGMMTIDKSSSIALGALSEIFSSYPNITCIQVNHNRLDMRTTEKSEFYILLYGDTTLKDIAIVKSQRIVPLFLNKYGQRIDLSTHSPAEEVPFDFREFTNQAADKSKPKSKKAESEDELVKVARDCPLVAEVNLNDEFMDVALDRIANSFKVTTSSDSENYFRVKLTNGFASAEFLMSRMNYQVVGMTDNGKWKIDKNGGPSYTGTNSDTQITDELIEEILNETNDSFRFWMDGQSINPYGAFYILAISEAAKSMPTRRKFFKMLYLVKNKIGGAGDVYSSKKAKLLRNDWNETTWSKKETKIRDIIESDNDFVRNLEIGFTGGRFNIPIDRVVASLEEEEEEVNITPMNWNDIIRWSLNQIKQRRPEINKTLTKKGLDKSKYLLDQLMNEIQSYIKRSKTQKK